MQHVHTLPFGATVLPGQSTHFRIWAPSADTLTLEIEGAGSQAMQAKQGGWYEATVNAPPGTQYRYRMPDGLLVPDPASRLQCSDVHDPSVVVDPAAYAWSDTAWRGRPWHEAVVYELHPGAMGGFSGIRQRLPELKQLGITVIELMPIADFPGPRNWGYDGVLPFAPDTAYGTPDELKALIDAAHGMGLMVMLDAVYNHFGPDGAYIHAFAKPFFRTDIATPWGAAIDFRRPEVCEYFTQNALYWLMEYRFDGLRLDAVHAISEEGFLRDLAQTIHRTVEPGRHVHLVLEHENNRAALLCTGADDAFDAQWADDMHHCLHVLLTGENEGYYEDFQDPTALLADCLAGGFAYQGQVSPHLGRPRGEPSGHLPTSAFVVCLQNHDQIGNRALGERLTTLADPQALRAATALLLLSPFIPMLFMGEEHGARNPFLFFTSHNDELAQLVRDGRRAEFKHFSAFEDEARRAMIPDPNAPATFDASVADRPDPAMFAFVQDLLTLRRTHIVAGIPGCRSLDAEVLAAGAVRAEWRLGTELRLVIALNLGAQAVRSDSDPGDVVFADPPGTGPGHLPPGSIVVQVHQA
ncbi:MAG: malto-oligosyltrehalose trehalohydrolase [Gemmatimonadaceae bacterium]|nr:malto-oligosyltrehalose trehalohydrolase [Acetobacteraceae bacterium]